MEKGQIFDITIEDMSNEGQGIGRAEGMVVFVPGAVVGDVVKVCLTKVKKNYALSRPMEILEYSARRNEGFDCASFENGCGGCPYGKMDYDTQLEIKERIVRERIKRLAGIENPEIRPIIGMTRNDNEGKGNFRYRNKAQFPVSTGGIITRKGGIVENLGEPAVGFYKAKSHEVVNCEDCCLQSMAAMAAAYALRQFMEEDNITAWDPKWEKGLMRHLIVKTGFTTGEVMVILVINGNGIPNIQKLVEMLDDAIYEVGFSLESVVLNIKKNTGGKSKKINNIPGGAGEIMGEENVVVAGSPVIRDMIGELEFEISPASFYQVNPVQTKRLYDKVKEYCGIEERDIDGMAGCGAGCDADKPIILDLYCGVGSIGLYCADMAKQVIGIESVKAAVLDANRNAVVNGIVNARYVCGPAERVLPEYVVAACGKDVNGASSKNCSKVAKTEVHSEGEKIDPQIAKAVKNANIAILDPPRAGCRPELLEAVAMTNVNRIVYVSCDPATQARDIKILGELGFEFKEATPADMFPHTGSVEVVSLLSRIKSTV